MVKFNDKIEFVPECPQGCKDTVLPAITRYQLEKTARVGKGYLVCCPRCFVAYFAPIAKVKPEVVSDPITV